MKSVIVETFNRSLRELMMKEFVKNNNTVWYNILPKLIKIYNNRFHSTIKMKPVDVNKNNEKYIKENIYTYNKTSKNPKFKVNDLVRISLKRRNLFDKASTNVKWSEELFKIHSINRSNVITYKIKDLNGEIIKGIFFEKELQKTKNTSEVYVIEKIIRKNKNKYLVKWRGYSNDFNSWIDKDDIIKYVKKYINMSFSNTQLIKNMTSQLLMTLRIRKNMSFSNTQLKKHVITIIFMTS